MDVSTSTLVTAAACVGAVAVGIYVVWGPDHLFRKRGKCPGLINLGNTCFMNAILQGLATLPPVREWLRASKESHPGPLITALMDVLTLLNEEREDVHSPSSILRALRCHHWCIDFQQQDAHELYHVMLTTLAEELTPCLSLLTDLVELMDKSGESTAVRSVAWTRAGCVYAPEKPIKCPLQGLLTSELLCCACHYSFPMRYETFDSLSLSLPTVQSQCTLQSCMSDYVKSEVVQEVECPQCSTVANKKVKRRFLKKLQLGRPPNCLCIHFKRTEWQNDGQLHKNNSFVSFPIRFDVTQYLKSPGRGSGHMYTLCAVTEHLGGPFSGHYQTYRRLGGDGKQWVCTSDTAVYSASTHDVLQTNAYMLFYTKSRSSVQ